jgi:tetratricopeptide (TPR) repeat protein
MLAEVGSRQPALESVTEAVAHYRQLAEADPSAFLPSLAMSINNHATMLSEVGRRQEALEAATEAVIRYRRLAEADPAAFLHDLTDILCNQANRLSAVGCWQQALEAITEAVAHYRHLVEADPAADQAGEAAAAGDATWLAGLLQACPELRLQPFSGAAASGVLALLSGEAEGARRYLSEAAEQGTETQRRALAGRLERLESRRPALADVIAELAALLSS